jgi:hypothetical protein
VAVWWVDLVGVQRGELFSGLICYMVVFTSFPVVFTSFPVVCCLLCLAGCVYDNVSSDGNVLESTAPPPDTDPLYYAQYQGLSQHVMKKPVTNGSPGELAPIDPNLGVPSDEQSDTEAHSMLQVIEALERDKRADQAILAGVKDG